MKLTRERRFIAWGLAAIVTAAGAFLLGGSLKPAAEPYFVFDTAAPAYSDTASIAALSPGGFTGFGDSDGTSSNTVLGGRVVLSSQDGLTLEAPNGQRTALRFAETPRVSRLGPGNDALLQPGATVSVRLAEDGQTAQSVLVLSAP